MRILLHDSAAAAIRVAAAEPGTSAQLALTSKHDARSQVLTLELSDDNDDADASAVDRMVPVRACAQQPAEDKVHPPLHLRAVACSRVSVVYCAQHARTGHVDASARTLWAT